MESGSSSLNQFVSEVVRLHELATGLKRLTSHKEIIAYGQSKGFEFSESEWNNYFQNDLSSQTQQMKDRILCSDINHWSWAFRQISIWRAMLMEGAGDS